MDINIECYKFPRTPHLEGSNLQVGDEDLNTIKFSNVRNKYLVVEEKMDGANSGISFNKYGELLLQSRGHYLNGGPREKQFELFKTWANTFKHELYNLLGYKYIMYGEWLYAKHTVFYDNLPHYFMEFDIYDKEKKKFLSTKNRKVLLKDFDFIYSVLVLKDGYFNSMKEITSLIGESKFKTGDHMNNLKLQCNNLNLNYDYAVKQTDNSNLMEGLYIKHEDENYVNKRFKYVRNSFTNTILDSESHWMNRPMIPNMINKFSNLFTRG